MKKSDTVVAPKKTRPAMLSPGEFVIRKLEIGFWSSFSAHCLYKDLVKEWLKNSKKDEEPS